MNTVSEVYIYFDQVDSVFEALKSAIETARTFNCAVKIEIDPTQALVEIRPEDNVDSAWVKYRRAIT